ncbi:unnamed protein product [Hyaloperonospora brassicae]|uniref:DNA replication regulator Sld3 C-terminal domain-containing protein n=1 Tax=Hyaloperonospora brassicae TaxID=162125 RepID=A0AAV0V2N7_HYABA|nr:unnamed protein product [Hyaloperonospora brassicae]
MSTDWRVEYSKAVAVEDARTTLQVHSETQPDKVLAFVDVLLAQEGGEWWLKLQPRVKQTAQRRSSSAGQAAAVAAELTELDRKQLKKLKTRLAAVGTELLVQLPALDASVGRNGPLRRAKVRVLQLQLVCRILRYGALTGNERRAEKKLLKKEIRGLLDRVALLLDAANPPPLTDDDAAERSPFQAFLEHHLGSRLMVLVPELVRYLLKAYEQGDDDEGDRGIGGDGNCVVNAVLSTSVTKVPSCSLREKPTSAMAGNDSILSALRQERSVKRERPSASEAFKEVLLPHQLKQKPMQSRPRKSGRRLLRHCSSPERSQSTTIGTPASAASVPKCKTEGSSTADQCSVPGSLCRAAAKTHTTPLFDASMPGHCRLQSSASSSTKPVVPSDPSVPTKRIRVLPKSTSSRTVSTSSVVGRTPERPKQLAARGTRVLVEASPPLCRPNTARSSAMRLLQPKTSRRGAIPPPLFQ